MFITRGLVSATLLSLSLLASITTASHDKKAKPGVNPTVCRREWQKKGPLSIDGVKNEPGTVKCVSDIVCKTKRKPDLHEQ